MQKSDGERWGVEAADRGEFIDGKAVFLAKQLQQFVFWFWGGVMTRGGGGVMTRGGGDVLIGRRGLVIVLIGDRGGCWKR